MEPRHSVINSLVHTGATETFTKHLEPTISGFSLQRHRVWMHLNLLSSPLRRDLCCSHIDTLVWPLLPYQPAACQLGDFCFSQQFIVLPVIHSFIHCNLLWTFCIIATSWAWCSIISLTCCHTPLHGRSYQSIVTIMWHPYCAGCISVLLNFGACVCYLCAVEKIHYKKLISCNILKSWKNFSVVLYVVVDKGRK